MTLKELIQGRYGISEEEFTKQDVETLVREAGLNYADGYLAFTIQDMLGSGELTRSARGKYRFAKARRNIFTTNPDENLKGLYSKVKERFPFVDFCIWDVRDLLPLMHHVPSMQMKIISCAKDIVESAAHSLANLTETIILPSPDRYALENIAFGREVIAVLPLVSQAPVEMIDGIPSPRLEKVLVDILCEEPFYYLQGSETYRIYETALKDYEVKLQTLRRYAGRRNRLSELENILKEIQS